jgi:hypothetical protein
MVKRQKNNWEAKMIIKEMFSEKQLKALKMLCNAVEQTLDREGEWDELSDALDVFAPLVLIIGSQKSGIHKSILKGEK